MSDKNTLWSALLVIAIVLFSSQALAANGFNYMPNIDPHTRFNPLRNDCYYYYGYGSCTVAKTNCDGVPVGRDRQLDLGDACKRNAPPTLSSTNKTNTTMPENVVVTENGKSVVYINRLSNIQIVEGQKVVINVTCLDEDPTTISYSGWTTTKVTQTDYDDSGLFDQTVTCTDSFKEKVSGSMKIKIVDENRRPLFKLFDWNIVSPKTNFTMTK